MTTDNVLQEFIDGKTVYTIAKTDAIAQIDAADGGYFYGIAEVPNLTDEPVHQGAVCHQFSGW